MALLLDNHTDQVVDLQGKTLHPDGAVLLAALDKSLTLRAYYSPDHEQFRQASDEAALQMAQAIRPRPLLSLEIKAAGVEILEQCLDPRLRQVRQMHELLVPLNVARLDILAEVSGADLRQALDSLVHHKREVGQSASFQEVVITNLPTTIRCVSCSVLHQGTQDVDNSEGQGSQNFDHSIAGPDQGTEKLARDFLDMVNRTLNHLEGHQGNLVLPPGGLKPKIWATFNKEDLRQGMQRLMEVNPSPEQLLQLIASARSALDLSSDAQSADLVFSILRKDILKEEGQSSPKPAPGVRRVQYKLTVPELLNVVDKIEAGLEDLPSLEAGVRENHLSIGLHLLSTDLPENLENSLLDSMTEVLSDPEILPGVMKPWVSFLLETLESGLVREVDQRTGLICRTLRRCKPEFLSFWWNALAQEARPADLPLLWPHLANDLLLGMGRMNKGVRRTIFEYIGQIKTVDALGQKGRLEELPAMNETTHGMEIMSGPLTRLYPLFMVMRETASVDWLVEALWATLQKRPVSLLNQALMPCLEPYAVANLDLFLLLMQQARQRKIPAGLNEQAAHIFRESLAALPRGDRKEKWVAAAVGCLADLKDEQSVNFLQQIQNERWLLVMKAWPLASRVAAQEGHAQGVQ